VKLTVQGDNDHVLPSLFDVGDLVFRHREPPFSSLGQSAYQISTVRSKADEEKEAAIYTWLRLKAQRAFGMAEAKTPMPSRFRALCIHSLAG